MSGKKISLRAKGILLVSIFLLTTNVALGVALMRQSRNAMKTQINERMLDIVNTAAAMLDGDVLGALSAEDEGTPTYQNVYDTLAHFRDNIKLDYIYYVVPGENKSFTFGIDPDPVEPGAFGSPVVYTDALYMASTGRPSVDEEPYEDQWGRFYSAFSPVFDSNGKVTAVVTADFGAAWYDAQINQNARTILLACFLFVAVGVAITFILTSQYTRQVEIIVENLNDLADDIDHLTSESDTHTSSRSDLDADTDDIHGLSRRISTLRNNLRYYISHTSTQANSMITAMAQEHRCVYHINLDENDGVCYRDDPTAPD